MVKKRMAMRMLTIFVALIVCGMFFPGLARGEDLSVDTGLQVDDGNTGINEISVDMGDAVVGQEKIVSVGISNDSPSGLRIWVTLDPHADCDGVFTFPEDPVNYPDPLIYPPFGSTTTFGSGDTYTIEVIFKPSEVGVCTAFLNITPMGSDNVTAARIDLTANGIEEPSETYIKIGDIGTNVEDRSIQIDRDRTSTLQEMIDYCKDEFERHDQRRGKLVRCIAWTTGELCGAGEMKKEEMSELRKAAAKLEWQTMIQEMRARRETNKSSRGGHRFWWLCRDR